MITFASMFVVALLLAWQRIAFVWMTLVRSAL
jgi:hypothetical protein